MSDDVYFYDPRDGHGLPHDPFKAILAPRIIGWISTSDLNGNFNLAPYSFFGAFSNSPKIIAFSSEGYKDTVRNIEATREFTWNLASRTLADAMNLSATSVRPEINEFNLAGVTPVLGLNVKAPRVSESPASFECKLLQVLRLKGLDGNLTGNWVVFGEVVGIHIKQKFLSKGRFDLKAADPILRAGYQGDYTTIGNIFELIRPLSPEVFN